MGYRTLGAVLGVAMIVSPARAGLVDIGGGWEAEWDDALDPFVDIVSNGVVGDAVFIEKSAEFFGLRPIDIQFRQTSPAAVASIVIDDEIITNSTGLTWTGFRMDVLDAMMVSFDPVATAASGGSGPIGFTIAPFTTAEFVNGNTGVVIGGGALASGTTWFPGGGATNGQLWIDAHPLMTGRLRDFTLRETPLIPAPGALAAVVGAGLLVGRRRRRPVG